MIYYQDWRAKVGGLTRRTHVPRLIDYASAWMTDELSTFAVSLPDSSPRRDLDRSTASLRLSAGAWLYGLARRWHRCISTPCCSPIYHLGDDAQADTAV